MYESKSNRSESRLSAWIVTYHAWDGRRPSDDNARVSSFAGRNPDDEFRSDAVRLHLEPAPFPKADDRNSHRCLVRVAGRGCLRLDRSDLRDSNHLRGCQALAGIGETSQRCVFGFEEQMIGPGRSTSDGMRSRAFDTRC